MRVTHVITRLVVGGAQENTISSVLGLQRTTPWDIRLISGASAGAEGSLAAAFADRPGTLEFLPELVRPVHPWRDWMALRRLTGIFRRTRPDIVHTHSGKAGVLGRLAASRARVPIIIHTIHGPSFGPFQGLLANGVFRAAERIAGRKTTHFVSVANAMTAQYLRAGIGRPEQYTKIASGFDLRPFLSATNDPGRRARWGIAPTDFVIGSVARLCRLKGHDDLLLIAPAVLKHHPQVRFLLVGDGDLRPRIQARVRALGLNDRFTFAGLVHPDEIPGFIGMMDLIVHLSLREGLPRVLPQALAAARPVLAYDCDGAREICLDNETGFLLRSGDLQGLAARLLQLIGDPALRARLGETGQKLVKEQFEVEKMVQDLHVLYVRLAAARQIPVT